MSCKLFVGNLPYSVTSERLQEAFSQFGNVTSSKVIVDRETGRSRGFAFLEMETDDQGAAAMQAMNGALLDGRSIAVREAVERQPGGGGGGGFGGGGGGGGRGPRPPYGGGGGGVAIAAAAVAAAMAAAAVPAVAVAIAAAAVAAAGGGGGGGGGYRGALGRPGGDGGPMRDRRADFSGGLAAVRRLPAASNRRRRGGSSGAAARCRSAAARARLRAAQARLRRRPVSF